MTGSNAEKYSMNNNQVAWSYSARQQSQHDNRGLVQSELWYSDNCIAAAIAMHCTTVN